ncbi:hypothetical protein GWC95_19560 [Sediminibacterium roseum]|uniref:Uncharacterized protein n=1 Tax=Sediminibacterium roseum TaxID=1978412 RepID=A0ABX0A4N0_9BACT|nr:hypothetical protein [Sediminibacterium roseum]NCI52131.1 hypothetical protein [Sediminibacterium roseum]
MKTASIQELKQELQAVSHQRLLELTLRLARFKKENKELLTYLLFESHDEEAYINSVKSLMEEGFAELPKANAYLSKKSLRKILRITNKYIKYAGSKQVEVALLISFCRQMKETIPNIPRSTVLHNLYLAQVKKINTALKTLHEDLQYDYLRDLEELALESGSFISKIFGKKK